MAMGNNGQGLIVSAKAGGTHLKTTTSQYKLVGMQPNTTTVDFTVYRCNAGVALEDTQTAYHVVGVNQTYMSASSTECEVVVMGLSKVECAASVAAGDLLVAYDGVSTTTRSGQVVSQSLIDATNVTCGAYGMTTAVQYNIVGRSLEDGSTGTVIQAIINPTPYDRQFWAHS